MYIINDDDTIVINANQFLRESDEDKFTRDTEAMSNSASKNDPETRQVGEGVAWPTRDHVHPDPVDDRLHPYPIALQVSLALYSIVEI